MDRDEEWAVPTIVEIIRTNHLPTYITDEDTKELKLIHMVRVGNKTYVSEELWASLEKKYPRKETKQ